MLLHNWGDYIIFVAVLRKLWQLSLIGVNTYFMAKCSKQKICNWTLMIVSVMMLISSIQVECWWLGMTLIWLHIGLGILFYVLIGWHLQLYLQKHNWFVGLKRQKSHLTRWLAVYGFLTLLTAIIATVQMFITWRSTAIGGWHGKIGFIFAAFAIVHIVERIRFYQRQ